MLLGVGERCHCWWHRSQSVLCFVSFRFLSFRFLVFRFVVAADTHKCVVAVCAINLAYKTQREFSLISKPRDDARCRLASAWNLGRFSPHIPIRTHYSRKLRIAITTRDVLFRSHCCCLLRHQPDTLLFTTTLSTSQTQLMRILTDNSETRSDTKANVDIKRESDRERESERDSTGTRYGRIEGDCDCVLSRNGKRE